MYTEVSGRLRKCLSCGKILHFSMCDWHTQNIHGGHVVVPEQEPVKEDAPPTEPIEVPPTPKKRGRPRKNEE